MNIINNAANILTETIMSIHKHHPEKIIKSSTSIFLSIQLLKKQKRKIKRAFIKSINLFLKSALNAISKKIKKQIKSHWSVYIKKRIQSLLLSNDLKSWRNLKKKKKMGYPSKGRFYPDSKDDTSITKADQDKLKQFAD